jgi:DNA-binding PucR family transcriptional regulator
VHPNTVDYRMAKVTRLTGLDPTVAPDAFRLRVALVAGAAP